MFCFQQDAQVFVDMHVFFRQALLFSIVLTLSAGMRLICDVSEPVWFADDEEEELSENETPKVKKKKKAKKSRESKGSKRRSRREVNETQVGWKGLRRGGLF